VAQPVSYLIGTGALYLMENYESDHSHLPSTEELGTCFWLQKLFFEKQGDSTGLESFD